MSIQLETQRMDFWCWAAVTLAFDKFFNRNSPRGQCDIAVMVTGQLCCNRPSDCDEAWSLRVALGPTGINHLGQFVVGRIPMRTVRQQRNLGLPFAARIGYPDGSGHFVIISGFRVDALDEGYLEVSDPWDDPVEPFIVSYRAFATAYRLRGVWTHTYLLRP